MADAICAQVSGANNVIFTQVGIGQCGYLHLDIYSTASWNRQAPGCS